MRIIGCDLHARQQTSAMVLFSGGREDAHEWELGQARRCNLLLGFSILRTRHTN